MLLTQSMMLKAYFINVSTSIHWFFIENFLNTSDSIKNKYDSISVNKDLFSELKNKEKQIEVLKSNILIADTNKHTDDQLKAINTNKTSAAHWVTAKSRFCTNDSLYAQLTKKVPLKKGALVIHTKGVIGLVANDCVDDYCLVKYINHPDTSIALNNKNDQVSGLMTVNKNNNLTLNYVNKNTSLIQNEVLYTAGFTPEQPAGFPVAVVSEKFVDLKNQFHFYLNPVESLNCPTWTKIWIT